MATQKPGRTKGAERRLYRLTFPDDKPRGSRYQTGEVERWLTEQQAAEMRRAVEHPNARLQAIEEIPAEKG